MTEVEVERVESLLRAYASDELAPDGYPPEWRRIPGQLHGIKDLVRVMAGHRCVRCGHPFRKGENGNGEWSPCDERCTHAGPIRVLAVEGWTDVDPEPGSLGIRAFRSDFPNSPIEARWRILTVHHLDGDKANCRWWNLASLCQRCHLTIQGRVQMARVWPWEHSDWFKPYVAGYYAWSYLGEDLSRAEVEGRLDELLALLERAP